MSISHQISRKDILDIIPHNLKVIDIGQAFPKTDSIRSVNQLNTYANLFKKALDEIHTKLPNVSTVHLFYAGPMSLAFRCGEMISSTTDPTIRVYNYTNHDSPKYKWSIGVNTPMSSPDFLIRY